jgi:hypothetical protein
MHIYVTKNHSECGESSSKTLNECGIELELYVPTKEHYSRSREKNNFDKIPKRARGQNARGI